MPRRWLTGMLTALLASTAAAQEAPTLVVTAGAAQLTLSWGWSGICDPTRQNPSLLCEFRIERSPGGDVCLFTDLESLPDTERNYSDATAAVGEKTCYRVIVVRNDGQRSSYSNVACGTAAPLPPPPPPPTGGLIEKTFTYPGNLNTVYVVANGAYQCERQAGATHRLRIRRTSTGQILGEVSVENPTKNVPFVLGCEVTATGENAYLNRVKRLMAAP